MAHKFDASARKKLTSEERRNLLKPQETLLTLGYQPGLTLADIGCGTGLFTFPAAWIASPSASVYAVDISQEMLDDIAAGAEKERLVNILPVKSEEYDFRLGDETADFVLMCTVLHEIDDKLRFLAETVRVCRTGGTVAVIDFHATQTEIGPPVSHRIARERVEELLLEAGFSGIRSVDIGQAFYAVTATK